LFNPALIDRIIEDHNQIKTLIAKGPRGMRLGVRSTRVFCFSLMEHRGNSGCVKRL